LCAEGLALKPLRGGVGVGPAVNGITPTKQYQHKKDQDEENP